MAPRPGPPDPAQAISVCEMLPGIFGVLAARGSADARIAADRFDRTPDSPAPL